MRNPVAVPILLTTLNAKYHHCAFGLRYLFANLGELKSKAKILEFTINQNSRDIAESILAHNPRIVGFGVYIWNTTATHEVISILKRTKPGIIIVLGGPEVSFETKDQAITKLADFTILGEAENLFYEFCRKFLSDSILPEGKWISGNLPEVNELISPYSYYTDEDIQNRVIYVEASRGCPYKCEYCLSSLDKTVRSFNLDHFLGDIDLLIQRGARQFKFVDRTFNLNIRTSNRILQFFLDRISIGLFVHFEMVPDRLPTELRELIAKFPTGSLQFEVGIQTWNSEVARLVSRRQDYEKIVENFSFLTQKTGVHLHADLIVGLPGETLESFSNGFDRVFELKAHEIQVGMLKRLKGTPIIRHDSAWEMVYQEHPPFQILQTKTMSFEILQEMNRFSRFWDLYANSGNFKSWMVLLHDRAQQRTDSSIFWEFFEFSKFLSLRHPQGNGIALVNLVESAWIYLKDCSGVQQDHLREVLINDYSRSIKRDIPRFLRLEKVKPSLTVEVLSTSGEFTPSRQRRHIGAPIKPLEFKSKIP